jgi:16S rRNA C967 or C1407 C5-methylase (RsmB/RsmF family)/NOL1/NOP2/fmu family ribosome biogenesis protein
MNLPQAFTDRMRRQLGQDYELFEKSLSTVAPVSIRLNRHKLDKVLQLEQIPWCKDGYYLDERPLFSSDPLWHAGAYYVQEASSMMLEQAFKEARKTLEPSIRVLDLCAAPGGKSTHLASLMDTSDVLVSNEVIKSRVPVLYENLVKHGYPNSIVTNADSAEFESLGEVFDIVLVDAPCSGEGLFRKDPEAVNEWNPDNVETCELRQKRILDNVRKCVKPGGYLIYSTCTYNPGENSAQVESLCGYGFEPVPFDISGIVSSEHQVYPHQRKGEGFYIALLRKTLTDDVAPAKPRKNKLAPVKTTPELSALLRRDVPFFDFEGQVLGIPEVVYDFYTEHIAALYCYAIGTKICKVKDKLYFPSEYLPFSQIVNQDYMPRLDLTQAEALSYLSNNILPYKGSEKGYVILNFSGVPVALGKFAGNRINNLFPNEWRLRKMPSTADWFSVARL